MKNKEMRKAIVLFTATALSASMLTGCSLFKPTANSLLKSCTENMQNTEDMDLDMEMVFAMDMSENGTTLTVDYEAVMDVLYEKAEDGFKAYMGTEVTLSMLGISQAATAESYMVGEDNRVTTYTKAQDEEEWEKKEVEKEDSYSFEFDFTNMVDQMTLQEDTVMEGDKECYVLTGDVKAADVTEILEEMDMENLGDVDIENAQAHVTMKVDKKEKLPVCILMEIDEDIFDEIMEEIQEKNVSNFSLSIKDCEVEIFFDERNTGKTVDIPDEVYDAVDVNDTDEELDIFKPIQENQEESIDDFGLDILDDEDTSDENSSGEAKNEESLYEDSAGVRCL